MKTGRWILRGQDQSLPTRNSNENIIKTGHTQYVDCANLEFIFTIPTPTEYKERYDEIGYYSHWNLYKYNGKLDCEKCYKH